MLQFPNIDPVALAVPAFDVMGFVVGPLQVHWYALAYIGGFFCGMAYLKRLNRRWPTSPVMKDGQVEDLFFWVMVGVILGGRLGYVAFYNLPYFMENPLDVLKVWQGGMSFHGGGIGAGLAGLLFAARHKLNWFDLLDRMSPAACFGLFFGRIANFINGELYGRVTSADFPLAMIFPHGGDLPRHPSQLYEAALEGILLFAILHFVAWHKRPRRFIVTGVFLVGYGVFRTLVEFVREPDHFEHLQGGMFEWVTMGQVLSIAMIIVGLGLMAWAYFKDRKNG